MSLLSSLVSDQTQQIRPKNYQDLINKVGANGRYQKVLFIIFCAQWFIAGFYFLSGGFMYLNRKFGCSDKGLLQQYCYQAVCKLDQSQWQYYLEPKQVESLATSFGPFYCQNQQKLSSVQTFNYIGAFAGIFIFSFFSDNFGRRTALIIAEVSVCVGLILLCASQNIQMASTGFLLVGAGNKGIIRIIGVVFSEVFQRSESSRNNILVMIWFAVGGCFVGVMFFILKDWRTITIVTILPNFILLYFMIFYLKETPKFLLGKNLSKAVEQLNKIGKINLNQDNILKLQELQSVIAFQKAASTPSKTYTPIDLFRFKSLRKLTIWGSLTSIAITFLYLAPITIINSFGFNNYLTQIVLCASQIIAAWLIFLKVNKLPRVKANRILLFLTLIFNGLVFFIDKPQECDNCIQGIAQLFLVFLMRFCTSMAFGIYILHMIQAFPQTIRGTGLLFSTGLGSLSSIFGTIILELIRQKGLNQMIIFPVISALGVVSVSFLPETLNKPLEVQIEQKKAIKKSSENQIKEDQ